MFFRTRTVLLIACLVSLAVSVSSAQQRRGAGFSLYARALLGEDGKPSIKVSAHIPYSNLVFMKAGEGFEAKFKLYIRIFDREGEKLIDSYVSTGEETVATYEDTRSQKSSATIAHQIDIAPGEYIVRCTVHVSNTHLAFADETPITVPDIKQSGVSVSKPRIYATAVDTSRGAIQLSRVPDGEDIYAEQTQHAIFVAVDAQPAFLFDVYLERATRDSTRCDVIYEVTDESNHQVIYGKSKLWLYGTEDRFVVTFNVDRWIPGEYVFNVKATVYDPTRATVTSLPFALEFTHAMLTTYFGTTLDIMAIIGSPGEIRDLQEAPEDERASLWAAFWIRRDPTPGTKENEALDEHFRRVRHANKEFKSNGPGWHSDRGKVYIRYGEPDEQEIKTDPYVQGQYLVWRYFEKNLTFVFYDRFGLGEYILSNSTAF